MPGLITVVTLNNPVTIFFYETELMNLLIFSPDSSSHVIKIIKTLCALELSRCICLIAQQQISSADEQLVETGDH